MNQKSFLSKRSSKISHIQSTSRHQLRAMEHSELFEPSTFSLSNIRLKFFLGEMAKKLRFLSPPLRKSDRVVQEWQKNIDEKQENSIYNSLQSFGRETLTQQLSNRYFFVKQLQIIEGILVLLFCWAITVSFVFQTQILRQLSYVIMILTLLKTGVKFKIIYDDYQKQDSEKTYEIDLFEDFGMSIIIFTAAIFMILRNIFKLGVIDYFVGIYLFTCVYLHWRRIGKYFSFLTQYAEHNKMRKQLRIIELFCFTIAMAHIFALIMYSMIYICPEGRRNWIQKADLENQPWYVHYIYSYYWANTTMVTVGYGDLTPNNFAQAAVVTMIQVVGTAIFGYMINVIGLTVNQIQKKNLQFEQHQATILKLREHYKLTRELCYKMKNDIRKKQSQSRQTPLKNNEQRQFLEYIDPSLREQFVVQTNMKVIKKSIFFLTHFSVNLQNQVALKLIRCIYKPEQTLSIQQNGQRQLVIINNGKINVFYSHSFHNIDKYKLSREIKPEQGKPTLNVFGFSSLIINRNIRLKAVTEQTATAYILKRKDILESITKNALDFESFNELRERMTLMKRVQDVQAPSIKDIQMHYLPNIYLLLKKVKHQKQQRSMTQRSKRKLRMKVITFKHYQNKTLLMIPHNINEKECESNYFLELQDKQAHKSLKINNSNQQLNIDVSKTFQNFLKNYNINVIAIEYQKACMKKSYNKRNRAISRRSSTKKIIKQF